MRTAIIDAILRRVDARQPTGEELREREERRRKVAQLVCEIADPPEREARIPPAKSRQYG